MYVNNALSVGYEMSIVAILFTEVSSFEVSRPIYSQVTDRKQFGHSFTWPWPLLHNGPKINFTLRAQYWLVTGTDSSVYKYKLIGNTIELKHIQYKLSDGVPIFK